MEIRTKSDAIFFLLQESRALSKGYGSAKRLKRTIASLKVLGFSRLQQMEVLRWLGYIDNEGQVVQRYRGQESPERFGGDSNERDGG